jgi:aspartate oxidase
LEGQTLAVDSVSGATYSSTAILTYWPEMPLTMKTTNTPEATGDGIVIGEKVGAQLLGMGFIQLMHLLSFI